MCNILVFQYKLISYEYFNDQMSFYEVNDLMEGIDYVDRVSWEQTRVLGYLSMAPHCKKLDMKKILPFKWDENDDNTSQEEKVTSISNEDIEKLKLESEKYEKYFSQQYSQQ